MNRTFKTRVFQVSLTARAVLLPASVFAEVFLRGTHNDWVAEAMLYQGSYQAEDILTFENCENVWLKFDASGDWPENYGDSDNVWGFNPGRGLWEGHLDCDGANIRVECGKTYLILFALFGEKSDGFRELNARVQDSLDEGDVLAFRKGIRGGGFYGSVSNREVLVRALGSDQVVEVEATDSQGNKQHPSPSLAFENSAQWLAGLAICHRQLRLH